MNAKCEGSTHRSYKHSFPRVPICLLSSFIILVVSDFMAVLILITSNRRHRSSCPYFLNTGSSHFLSMWTNIWPEPQNITFFFYHSHDQNEPWHGWVGDSVCCRFVGWFAFLFKGFPNSKPHTVSCLVVSVHNGYLEACMRDVLCTSSMMLQSPAA